MKRLKIGALTIGQFKYCVLVINIDGVSRFGKSWAAPSDAERLDDKKVKTENCKSWLKIEKAFFG